MKRRLVDDAEREWGSQKDRGRWRQAPEGSTAWLLEEGVSGMGQRKVAGIWKRMKSQRGKLGDEGLEVVERMVECAGAVEDSAENCRKGAREGMQTGTGSKNAEVAGMLQWPNNG